MFFKLFVVFMFLNFSILGAAFVPLERIVSLDFADSVEVVNELEKKGIIVKKLKTTQNILLLSFKQLKISENQIDEYLLRFPLHLIEKNYLYKINNYPNDQYFPFQWGMNNEGENSPLSNAVSGVDISLINAWRSSIGNSSIKISIIDTGVDYTHVDLAQNMWTNSEELNGITGVDDDGNGYIDDIHGYNFVDDNGDPLDINGHGTHCAGVIGAISDNNIGIVGVMKHVTMIPIQFLSASGSGTTANAIQSVSYAVKMGSDIISNSWGGGGYSELLKKEIEIAKDEGIIFVVAAGNNGSNNDKKNSFPADYDLENIIVVASHNSAGKLAKSSNYGIENVDIAAPGVLIYSTLPGDKYGYKSGTSMAAPHVSGAIGLILDFEGPLSFYYLKSRLNETAVFESSFLGKINSGGRLNIEKFLKDFRIPVERPDPYLWKSYVLSTPFETGHPYSDNLNFEKEIHIPGAKFIIVQIEKMELENHFDFLRIYNGEGEFLEKLSGDLYNYESLLIAGDKVKLKVESDFAKTKWGVRISNVLWQ